MENTLYEGVWIAHRADPYVYRHTDANYYFTATLPGYDGIALRRAKGLAALADAEEVMIWRRHDRGCMGAHIWAPELHYINGRWYLYFAAGDMEDKWRIRPYVLECSGPDPLRDAWIERGMVQSADGDEFSFQNFSLDMTVFEHKAEYYCVWAEKVGVGKMISNLYIARMESPVKLATVQRLLTTPDYEWERKGFWVNEGAAVIKRDGRIFLTYSASDTGAAYCLGMLSVGEDEDILDRNAWTKKRLPVLATAEEKGIYGPGHNSFTVDEKGEAVIVFHARTYKEIQGDPLDDPNRHAMLRKVHWTAAGEPIFLL